MITTSRNAIKIAEPYSTMRPASTLLLELIRHPGFCAPVLEATPECGYTFGMKTAVSIPDAIFEKVERLARLAGKSRSEVFSAALSEYVARHVPDEVTEAIDRVCEQVDDRNDTFVTAAARCVLENTEW